MNNIELIIEDIRNNKFNNEIWISNKYPDFYFFIKNKFNLDISWKEKLFLYENSIDYPPLCYCGNNLKFVKGRYHTYCSIKCMSNDKKIIEQRRNSCINKYGVDCPTKNDYIRKKVKGTTILRYNVSNVSKLESIKLKVKQTNNDKYGVDYVSKKSDVRLKLSNVMKNNSSLLVEGKRNINKLNIQNKINIFNLKLIDIIGTSKYRILCDKDHIFDIDKNMLNDRIRNGNTICTICNEVNTSSNAQDQIFYFIKDNYKGEILKNKRSIISKELDIYLPELKISIEYNGLYWHSDIYKEILYHYNKTEECLRNGINLIHIWEDDWINKKDIVKSKILDILSLNHIINSDSCEIVDLSIIESKIFLKNNDLNYINYFTIPIGLLYNSEIVSIMVFDIIDNHYELIEFCDKKYTSVLGGSLKLFNYFLTHSDNNKIVISYHDRSWFNYFYKECGFIYKRTTIPNYNYVINGYRKNTFINFNKYSKIYDCGHDEYIYYRK